MDRPLCVVAADDLEETGMHALGAALDLVRHEPDAHLHVVHVVTDQEIAVTDAGTRLSRIEHLLATIPDRLWSRVREAGARHPARPPVQVSCHVRLGVPSEQIVQVAVDYEADWIVVGTHGRRGIERVLLGSTAELVVRTAPAPVVVARPVHYEGLAKSERPEPPEPGVDLHRPPPPSRLPYFVTERISWTTPPQRDLAGPTGRRIV
ncbi:MAG: universal stress protein [Myxococcota bacterium]|nr:universal stress protein [Myxococcota bacterium]MDW8361433.1 universal stress protein [Myxococcales bacterium]